MEGSVDVRPDPVEVQLVRYRPGSGWRRRGGGQHDQGRERNLSRRLTSCDPVGRIRSGVAGVGRVSPGRLRCTRRCWRLSRPRRTSLLVIAVTLRFPVDPGWVAERAHHSAADAADVLAVLGPTGAARSSAVLLQH